MTRPVVVNTRPREQASELTQLLGEAGFEPWETPAIVITPAFDAAEVARLRHNEYAWLVLQSANAGRYLSIDFDNVPILCGRATADALQLRSAFTLEQFSADAALDWLRRRVQPGDRVLIPRAAEGRDELIIGLSQLGVTVDTPIVYRTEPASRAALAPLAHRLRAGEVAAITFCSPSAAQAVVAAVDVSQTPCICLGLTTASALARLNVRVAVVAHETSMSSLVSAVQQALSATGLVV